MEESYRISRYIIFGLTFLGIIFMFGPSSISVALIISFISLAISFFCSNISRKIIDIGENIDNMGLRIIYYLLGLPLLLFLLFFVSFYIIYGISNMVFQSEDVLLSWTDVITLFTVIIVNLIFFIPYIQSILVIIIDFLNYIKE